MKKVVELTDDEIRFAVEDILKFSNIQKIERDFKEDEIVCFLGTEWETEEDVSEETIKEHEEEIRKLFGISDTYKIGRIEVGVKTFITDELRMSIDSLRTGFKITEGENRRWQQFLIAQGINPLLENNPYLEETK